MATKLAEAYVQIIPAAQGFEAKLKEIVEPTTDGLGDSAGKNMGSKLIGGLAAAFTAAKVGEVMKAAFSEGAALEQSIGGVETLFKDSSDKVVAYARNAYKTAGLSANEYMENVTSFSASLLASLKGDTEKAAESADMAMRDMSDNANKFGTDISSIQNAYQGFAKQNYTMLDNLKLGFGGTKEEMQRLLEEAGNLTSKKYDISSLSDVYEAIHVIQQNLDITGTTAKEAEKTFSGSMAMMQASAKNLLGTLTAGGDIKNDADALVNSSKAFADNFARMAKTMSSQVEPAFEGLLEGLGMSESGAKRTADAIGLAGVSLATYFAVSKIKSIESLSVSFMELAGKIDLAAIKTKLLENSGTLAGTALVAAAMLIKQGVDKATDAIDETNAAFGRVSEETSSYTSEIGSMTKALDDLRNESDKNVSQVGYEAEGYKTLTDQLYALDSSTKLTTEDKAEMKAIVDELNGSVKGLNIELDEESGHLITTKASVDSLIESYEAKAKATAIQNSMTEEYIKLSEMEIKQEEAKERYDQAKEKRKNLTERLAAAQKELAEQNELANKGYDTALPKIESLNAEINSLNNDIAVNKNEVAEYATAYINASESVRNTETHLDKLRNQIRGTGDDTETATNKIAKSVDYSMELLYTVGNNTYTVTTETADSIAEIQKVYSESVNTYAQDIYDKLNLFEEFPQKAEVSADKLMSNLDSNLSGITEWGDNMEKLVDKGVSEGLIEKLREAGPSSAAEVKALTQMTDTELAKYSDKWDEAYKAAHKAAKKSMKDIENESAIQISNLIKNADDSKDSVKDAYDILGYNCGVGFAAGMKRSINAEVDDAAKTIVESAMLTIAKTAAIASPSKRAAKLGEYIPQGFAIGMESKSDEVMNAAKSMTGGLFDTLEDSKNKSYGIISRLKSTANSYKVKASDSSNSEESSKQAQFNLICDGKMLAKAFMPYLDALNGVNINLTSKGVAV